MQVLMSFLWLLQFIKLVGSLGQNNLFIKKILILGHF